MNNEIEMPILQEWIATEDTLLTIPAETWKLTEKVPDVTWAEVLEYFTFDLEWWDIVTTKSTSNWQNVTALIINPTTNDKRSIITQIVPIKANAHTSAIEASMNQRVRHQVATMEMSTNEVVPVYDEFAITSLQQATTTLTLNMTNPVDWTLWDWIDISWCADNRLNYSNFVIWSISANMKTITWTTSDEATIQSLTVWPISTVWMTAKKRRQLLGQDWYGMRFSWTSATATAYLSKFGANITKVTWTLNTNQTVTCASTAPTFTLWATWQVDIRTTSKFFSRWDADWVMFSDKAIDSNTSATVRNFFSWVKPGWQKSLYAKYNAISPKSMTRPIAKIVSAVKTWTTTATITTDVPHWLTTSNYVTIKGIRDVTNFPALTTPTVVASTPTTTTFTIVIGWAVTATSYGWSVILANWWVDQPWIIGQVVQSIAVSTATWLVTLVWNTTWAWLNIWEYVYLHWCRNSTNGADLWYDWAWEVVTLSTSTLIVKPVIDYLGTNISPTLSTLTTTNCGWTIILMTTLRSHDSIMTEYTPQVVRIEWQGTLDYTKALLVNATLLNPTSSQPNLSPATWYWTSLYHHLVAAAWNNLTSVKASVWLITSIHLSNTTASAKYFKLYNKASAPVLASDVPVLVVLIPPTNWRELVFWAYWLRLTTWIAYALTTWPTNTDTGAMVANDVIVNINYT